MKHKVFKVLKRKKKKVDGEKEEIELSLLVAEEEFLLVQALRE